MNSLFFLTLLATGLGLIVNGKRYAHMTAQFGVQSRNISAYERSAPLVVIDPANGCHDIVNGVELKDAIVLVKKDKCHFIDQAINVVQYGGVGMVVGNNQDTLIWMAKPSKESPDVDIPCVSVARSTYESAIREVRNQPTIATISKDGDIPSPKMWNFPSLIEITTWLLIVFPAVWAVLTIKHFCRRNWSGRREQRRRRILSRDIPEILFMNDLLDPDSDAEVTIRRRKTRLTNNSCPICLENFEEQIKIKLLSCEHGFHSECIGPWIAEHSACPICRQTITERLEYNQPQSRCRCCCHCPLWWVPSEEEIRQPLLISDADEDELDIEVPVAENFEGFIQPVEERIRNLSLRRVEVKAANDDQPNSVDEYRLSLDHNQVTDQVDVKIEDSKHEEGGRATPI